MSGFKIERNNVLVEYFGTSNTLKLNITEEDFLETGQKEYHTSSIFIDPFSRDLDDIIDALQEARKLL